MDRYSLTMTLLTWSRMDPECGWYVVAYLAAHLPPETLEAAVEAAKEFRATPPTPQPSERLLTLVRERFPDPQ